MSTCCKISEFTGKESISRKSDKYIECLSLCQKQPVMDSIDAFIKASVWYGSTDEAEALLVSFPAIAESSIYTAALLGNETTVRRFLANDPSLAFTKGGALGWDALTYLCFSRFLRRLPSGPFVSTAQTLINAGADVNTGFFDDQHTPHTEWESVLYGASGVAFHPELTRLLLNNGANPNDNEVPYHSPESYDNRAFQLLLDSGKMTADSLATMLLRKCDIHDTEGIRLALQSGADPNRLTIWGVTALHQAILRDNQLQNILMILEHGANPGLQSQKDGRSAIVMAAQRGRADVLQLFRDYGFDISLQGMDELARACAMDESATGILSAEYGGMLLGGFAGNNNAVGIGRILALDIQVDTPYVSGDGYFGIPKNSTALQIAAWRGAHDAVKTLINNGADVNAKDTNGNTPLSLAIRACTDSYWMDGRKPDSIAALISAGAKKEGIILPTGYDEADRLFDIETNSDIR